MAEAVAGLDDEMVSSNMKKDTRGAAKYIGRYLARPAIISRLKL
ncbi:hypothetical protein [Paenibacillus sp. OV219]|nr:hypothetical protein [Paenibacillus sp. OV219]